MNESEILNKIEQKLYSIEGKSNYEIKNTLDWAYRKLKVIIERKFGKENNYVKELEQILISANGTNQQSGYQHAFRDKIKNNLVKKCNLFLNIIDALFTEFELDKVNNHPKDILSDVKEDLINSKEKIDRYAIFVVHGRNEPIRKSMFDFLRSIGLKPIEWEVAIKMTRKTNPYIGEILDTAFNRAQAILVLFTPDDLVKLNPRFYKKDEPIYEKELTGQARPNVLFEAGMAIGRNPDRTILVQIGNVKPFSDIAGRYMIRFHGTSEDRRKLTNRLESVGCDINLTGTDWLNTGDFTIQENENSEFKEEKISKDLIEIKKNRVQKLFNEFTELMIRLYKSKASTSYIFAQKIHNSLEMQEYFGITAKRPTQPEHTLNSEPINFLYKLFKITPSNAYFTYDYNQNGKFEKLLDKTSASDEIRDVLPRFFNKVIEFVDKEFNIELEYKGHI